MRRRSTGGIPAWGDKLAIARWLLPAMTDREVVDEVLPGIAQETFRTHVLDSFRKWHSSTPTKKVFRQFFDELARRLGCATTVTWHDIIFSDLEEFIELLPADRREKARQAVSGVEALIPPAVSIPLRTPSLGTPAFDDSVDSMLVPHGGKYESIRTGVSKGQIDMAHYYTEAEAAESWNRLVRADTYPTYDHCKAGLRALVNHDEWRQALSRARPMTAVMLAGGGAPTKDLVILKSMLEQIPEPGRISMFLVDTSPYMLFNSKAWLDGSLDAEPGLKRVDVRMVHDNVLNLTSCRNVFRRAGGQVLFAITGGTIGNLKEGSFFTALERVADSGDLLILSADTVDASAVADALAETERYIEGKYNNREMRRFIASGVSKVMRELAINQPLDAVLERVEARISRSACGFSDVPGSWSVRLVLPMNNDEITLVSSTRYVASQLTQFAGQFGWQTLCIVTSPVNSHYTQFFLRKVSEKAGAGTIPSRGM